MSPLRTIGPRLAAWACLALSSCACLALSGCAPGTATAVGGGSAEEGEEGEVCGTTVCAVDQRCCGCGLCASAGQACPPVGCEGDGGVGLADGSLPAAICGSNEDCGLDERCDFGSCEGGAGTCAARPETCPSECDGVCGCDGAFYCNACVAALAGVGVEPDGSCAPPSCAPMEAVGEGPCGAFFGYAWDGGGCAAVNGCSCVGPDCGGTFEEPEACEAAHRSCMGG